MSTIGDIRNKLSAFHEKARDQPDNIKQLWDTYVSIPISDESVNSFTNYYRNMRNKTRKMAGGASYVSAPAPLQYSMTPGSIGVYGQFPTEVATDQPSLLNLDVFYANSQLKGCGTENSSLPIPKDMGSNQVGGKRSTRKNRRDSRRRRDRRRAAKRTWKVSRNQMRKNMRKTRRMKGGDLLESIASRPYLASTPPNMIQTTVHSLSGDTQQIPFPSDPTEATWAFLNKGIEGVVNPGTVATIPNTFLNMANPAPWSAPVHTLA